MNSKRDYSYFDRYYQELVSDIYEQPPDKWHISNMRQVILDWIAPLSPRGVLDVGCGEAHAQLICNSIGISYYGWTVGKDFITASEKGADVSEEDFNFSNFPENWIDMIFSRHSLEHSPFPIITLMEWHRIASKWLCLVLPNPEHFTFTGRNHYSVMTAPQAAWILRRAGWQVQKVRTTQDEIWFLCKKMPRIGYEGWAEVPLSPVLHEFERDLEDLYGEIDYTVFLSQRKDDDDKYRKWVKKQQRKGKLSA